MNVKTINELLLRGEIDRDDMWPRLQEYEAKATPYLFEFGLDELPLEPGLLLIRGPRQYGKSTWMDLQIRDTIEDHGRGSALFLSGDECPSGEQLYEAIVAAASSFRKDASVRRLFIDEVTAVPNWERALKRAFDEGATRRVLVVTTGSRAADLLRGTERLPGRKGRLERTTFHFLPVSYRQFKSNTGKEFGARTWLAYLLAGGAPLACNDIYQFERLPEYFIELIRDWVIGDIVRLGRSRLFLTQVLSALYRFGGTPVGYAKVAREAGLANNTVASGYLEQLSDLLCVTPQWQIDAQKKLYLFRKPAKFCFINLAAAVAFHPAGLRHLHEFELLPPQEQAVLTEWLVGQELYRRAAWRGEESPQVLGVWRSSDHEIDFADFDGNYVEVKLGKATAIDFVWFTRSFPRAHLTVICSTPFTADRVRGITMDQFLLEGPTRMRQADEE